VFLIVDSGAGEVARAMLVLGWWLLPITLFHLVPLFLDAVSWRELIPASSRPNVFSVTWIRWIRESVSSLLPVAGVGGDIAAARLAHQQGVPGVQAAASMVVDITVGAATQMVFVIAGVALLAARASDRATVTATWALLIGVAVFAAAIAAFVLVQHRSMFMALARLARRVAPEKWLNSLTGSASAIDDAVAATYRRGFALLLANLLRLVGLAAGAGEIWLVMHFLMRPFSATDAFILESLSSGVRAAAFMVPGALGVFEGGLVAFGALFGLPADIALAISLAKRVRELALGLPGLVVWQWVEGHYLMRRGARL
jgi:putative membrane protein